MKFTRTAGSTTAFLCLALLGFHTPSDAQTSEKKSAFVLAQAAEVPGTVLQPGSYVIRLKGPAPAGAPAGANLLEILSADESRVYATITSIPELRPPLDDKAIFSFYQSPEGHWRAIKAWWPKPDPYPREEQFIYPTGQALSLIAATKENILYLRPGMVKDAGSPTDAPAMAPVPQVQAGHGTAAMPKTASDLPLLVLAGVVFCCVGLCLRGLSMALARAEFAASPVMRAAPRKQGAVSCLLSGTPIRLRLVYRKGSKLIP